MKKLLLIVTSIVMVTGVAFSVQADPTQDLRTFQNYYKKKFPNVKFDDFGNGIYALNKRLRDEWEITMEFPPFGLTLEDGERLFNKPFKNGKTYASCFKNGGRNIAQNYPYFDVKRGMVKTIELEINECRKRNGEKKLKYKKGPIVAISAYIHSMAKGKRTNVKVPNNPAALAAYNKGKEFFYARRGQLNFSCAHCHGATSGMMVGGNVLSPALGQTSHFPAYRSKWGAVGTIHRRYTGCNKQVRAKPFKGQSKEYRNLQYFHTYMSNGIPLNAPGTRF